MPPGGRSYIVLKRVICLFLCTITLLSILSSCALLPEEEELPRAPVIKTVATESYNLAFAERGDMLLTQRVNITFLPVKTEALRFEIGGEYIDEVFTEVGANVRAGDILAQVRVDDVTARLKSATTQLNSYKLQLIHLEENLQLALARQEVAGRLLPAREQAEAIERINEDYAERRRSLNDNVYIQEQTIEELTRERDRRTLVAGIDGTVTYVKRTKAGDMSVAGERFIAISDSTTSAFRAETDMWEHMGEGDEYLITVDKVEYLAVVVSEESLDLTPQEKAAGEKANVYLMLKEPQPIFEDGDRGYFNLVLDSREGVLMIPEGAVTSANGEKIVYYQDDEGMKDIKRVVTGLVANGMVEIIEGLEEGDNVII